MRISDWSSDVCSSDLPMAISLSYDPAIENVVRKSRDFVRDHVMPIEDEFAGDITAAGGDERRLELRDQARDAGVLAPHAPVEYGGLGLNMSDRAPVFEAAGYSVFGPIALHIGAPDEGKYRKSVV